MYDRIQAFFSFVAIWARSELSPVFGPFSDWYYAHLAVIQPWMDFLVEWDVFRRFSAVMCGLYCLSIWSLGVLHFDAMRKGGKINHFPRIFLATIVFQIPSMLIIGIVERDPHIIGTRAAMLFTVVAVFSLTLINKEGSLNNWKFKSWILFWLWVCMLVPMSWEHDGVIREFVETHDKLVSWSIVASMAVFMIGGQLSLARALFTHFFVGEKSSKRLLSQLPRFGMLASAVMHYWWLPTGAALVVGCDPVFLQSAIGTVGTTVVLVAALIGWIFHRLFGALGWHKRQPATTTA